jgi:hypothetical protein
MLSKLTPSRLHQPSYAGVQKAPYDSTKLFNPGSEPTQFDALAYQCTNVDRGMGRVPDKTSLGAPTPRVDETTALKPPSPGLS